MGVREPDLASLIDSVGRCSRRQSILQVGVVSILAPPESVIDALVEARWCERVGTGHRFRHNGPRIVELINSGRYLLQEGLRGMTVVRPDFLFHALGFDEVCSLDVSPHDEPGYLEDLNDPDAWRRVGRQFDVVLELGTLEHVFHIPNAMWNLAKLCAVGGEILHGAPMNNWPNHGFYQLQPTLYYDFYEANGFEVVEAHLLQMPDLKSPLRFKAPYRHERTFDSPIPLDGRHYNFFCRVRKLREPERLAVPQQGAYAAIGAWRPERG